jgi:hypothetical protein
VVWKRFGRVEFFAWVARPESSKGVGGRSPRPSKTQGVPPGEVFDTAKRLLKGNDIDSGLVLPA